MMMVHEPAFVYLMAFLRCVQTALRVCTLQVVAHSSE